MLGIAHDGLHVGPSAAWRSKRFDSSYSSLASLWIPTHIVRSKCSQRRFHTCFVVFGVS